jgi:hypothetical protein
MLSSLGVAPVSGIYCFKYIICYQKIIYFLIDLDVLSSLTTSPNKSELLYNSMSTPDSSAKGSLPQTPATG